MPCRRRGTLAPFALALALAADPLSAQTADEAVPGADGDVWIVEEADPALQPLTAREARQAAGAVQADLGAAMRAAGNRRVRIVSVERHEEEKGAAAGERRADVVLYNYATDETIAAVVRLGPTPAVEAMTVTAGEPPGLGAQEVEEAKRLALADPRVQEALRARGLGPRELTTTHIGFRAQDPDDACARDRCVLLFFNTPDAVVDVQPIVNLSTGEVAIR